MPTAMQQEEVPGAPPVERAGLAREEEDGSEEGPEAAWRGHAERSGPVVARRSHEEEAVLVDGEVGGRREASDVVHLCRDTAEIQPRCSRDTAEM